MAKQNYTAEQIIVKLREVEVLCAQGKNVRKAVRSIGISEQTYYRWRNKYGEISADTTTRSGKRKCPTQKTSGESEPASGLKPNTEIMFGAMIL